MTLRDLTQDERRGLDEAIALKTALVEFALTPPFQRPLRACSRRLRDTELDGPSQLVEAVEALLFEHRYDDGGTVLDRFARRHPRLPEGQRALLDSWKGSVHGAFEVRERAAEQLLLTNLFDELEYRVVATSGPDVVEDMHPESFVISRILPVGDLWVFSGTQASFPPESRPTMAEFVAREMLSSPELVLRNPAKRRLAAEQARSRHESFLLCFGTDRLLVSGPDVVATYRRYLQFHDERVAGPGATTTGDGLFGDQSWDALSEVPGNVAVIHRPDVGVWFLVDYDLVEEAFADPGLLRRSDRRRSVVREYLEDSSIPPWVFEDLSRRYGRQADTALAIVLNRHDFRWEQDGEALMRARRPGQLDRPVFAPGIVPAPTIALEHLAPGRSVRHAD